MFGYFDTMLRYFEFAGRSSRTQYWVYTLVSLLLLFGALYVDIAVLGYFRPGVSGLGPLTLFCVFIHIVPNITVTVRRLHDSGRSGWWYWICLVPFIGGFWLLVLMFLGPDGYGANELATTRARPPGRRPAPRPFRSLGHRPLSPTWTLDDAPAGHGRRAPRARSRSRVSAAVPGAGRHRRAECGARSRGRG